MAVGEHPAGDGSGSVDLRGIAGAPGGELSWSLPELHQARDAICRTDEKQDEKEGADSFTGAHHHVAEEEKRHELEVGPDSWQAVLEGPFPG